MSNDGASLGEQVARAADAWLTDPRDVVAYQHLVDAVTRWRAHRQPMLAGTEHAGRRRPVMDPQLDLALGGAQGGALTSVPAGVIAAAAAVIGGEDGDPAHATSGPVPDDDVILDPARAPAALGSALGELMQVLSPSRLEPDDPHG